MAMGCPEDSQEHIQCLADTSLQTDIQLFRSEPCTLCPVFVYSIVGSMLSLEVTKAITHVGEPMFNVFVFDGRSYEGKAFPLIPTTVPNKENKKRKAVEEEEVLILDD